MQLASSHEAEVGHACMLARAAEMQVIAEPGVDFRGNVSVGSDISIAQLRSLYHVLILAHGAAGDRQLSIPGDDLSGVLSARAFVGWYNGHPDCAELGSTIESALAGCSDVVVIGVGNVALDCARILAKGAYGMPYTNPYSYVS